MNINFKRLVRTASPIVVLEVASLFSLFESSSAFAWGHVGHQTIASVATTNMATLPGSDFWAANSNSMATLTNIPDTMWKSGPTANNEKPTHWFQADSYFSDMSLLSTFPRAYPDAVNQYTEATVINNGTAPWRVMEFYALGVQALNRNDFVTAVQMAGAMSHYIGDLSQPLHISENFDGAETGDPGIHKFFETTNLSANQSSIVSDVTAQTQALLQDPNFLSQYQNLGVEDMLFQEVATTFPFKDGIIQTDQSLGRGPDGGVAQYNLAVPRLAEGAAVLALVLSRMWVDGGATVGGATVSVALPSWVAPDFDNMPSIPSLHTGPVSTASVRRRKTTVHHIRSVVDRDDCEN